MRLSVLCVSALLLNGCSFVFSEGAEDMGAEADAGADADLCAQADLLLTQPGVYLFDTTTGVLSTPGAAIPCLQVEIVDSEVSYLSVKVGGRFEVGPQSRLMATGIRALEIESAGDMRIRGVIDASSRVSEAIRGAGADVAECSQQVDADAENNSNILTGGGGGGGSLTRNGASGGNGSDSTAQGAPTGTTVSGWENTFRGGCRGGDGATRDSDDNMGAAAGGQGGGAIRLVTSGELLISGLVHASGAGGEGGLGVGFHGGGGGGGSGGMVWLRANQLTIGSGGVSAKGGGGGEGGNACGPGADGQDAAGLLQEQAAGGLTDVGCDAGGDGGGGSFGDFSGADPGIDGDGGIGDGGGGGGGGAPGIIFLEVLPGSVAADRSFFSPPPMTPGGADFFP